MQPLRVTIAGNYWDSYIYEGRLYIFGSDGAIRSLDWDHLIREWKVPEVARIAFICAFLRSDYLYLSDVRDLLKDPEIQNIMQRKFRNLERTSFEVTKSAFKKNLIGEQDSPCPFPHADIEVYRRNMYIGSVEGLYRATCNKRTRYPISSRPEKTWDGPALSISASYNTVAIAAGDEGLFEISTELGLDHFNGREPKNTSSIACRDCSWTYFSLFASSSDSGYLAEYSKLLRGRYERSAERQFLGIIPAANIFGSDGYSWGVKDKFFQAGRDRIKVIKYVPWAEKEHQRKREIGSLNFARWKGEVISASAAPFGTVVELERAIVVLPSKGKPITLKGEPVNWRVFPRSRHYENQLHVVYEDRVEILSFNHDYLVDQEEKLAGTSVSVFAKDRRGRASIFVGHGYS